MIGSQLFQVKSVSQKVLTRAWDTDRVFCWAFCWADKMVIILVVLLSVGTSVGLNLGSVFRCSKSFSFILGNGSSLSFPFGMSHVSQPGVCRRWNGTQDYKNLDNAAGSHIDSNSGAYRHAGANAVIRDERVVSSTATFICFSNSYRGSSHHYAQSVGCDNNYFSVCQCKDTSPTNYPTVTDVVQLAFTDYATASLDKFGTVKAWGIINGFDRYTATQQLNPYVDFVASACLGSLVFHDLGNSMRGWSRDFYYSCNSIELHGVKMIAGATGAFAALFHNGTVKTWGEGPGSKDVAVSNNINYRRTMSPTLGSGGNRCIYCFENSRGQPRGYWTGATGGSCSCTDVDEAWGEGALTNVEKIYSGENEFLALRTDGRSIGWGKGGGANLCEYEYSYSRSRGGTYYCSKLKDNELSSGVVGVERNSEGGWVALKEDGSVVCFGLVEAGGACTQVSANGPTGGSISNLRDVVRIVGGRYQFVALRSNGGVVTWGKWAQLCIGTKGQPKSVPSAECAVYHTSQSYGWKELYGVGSLESVLSSGVLSVTGNDQDWWAAIKSSGKVVVWGTMDYFIGNQNDNSRFLTYWTIENASPMALLLSGAGKRDGRSTTSFITEVQGNTVYRADGEYPLVNVLDISGNPYPTSQPSGEPTSQPSTEPTGQPSSAPSGQPTGQPTGQPSSQPSGTPTTYPTEIARVHYQEQQAKFNLTMLTEGKGMHFTASHTFANLGQFRDYYLSLYLYDTGFGPSSSGQYITFSINGDIVTNNDVQDITRPKSEVLPVHCAPLDNGRGGCNHTDNGGWVACAYNIPIKDKIKRHRGGSIRVSAMSSGVSDSSCPYTNPERASDTSVVYVKLYISPALVDTPVPSAAPTPVPTKTGGNVYNSGVVVNVNSLNVWNLVQISVAVGVIFAAIGVTFAKLREKSVVTHKLPLLYASITMSFSAMEFVSMVMMLISVMGESHFVFYGGTIAVFRLCHCGVAYYVLGYVYSGDDKKRASTTFANLVDMEHLMLLAKPYSVIGMLSFLDCSTLIFLPWFPSSFATLSKGYPTMEVFQPVQFCVVSTAVVTVALQIPFLAAKVFDVERDLFSVINICMMCLKAIFAIVTFLTQRGGLQRAEIANKDEIMEMKRRKEEADVENGRKVTMDATPHHSMFGDIYPSSGTEGAGVNMGGSSNGTLDGVSINPLLAGSSSLSRSTSIGVSSNIQTPRVSRASGEVTCDFRDNDSDQINEISFTVNPMLNTGTTSKEASMAISSELVRLREEHQEMKAEMALLRESLAARCGIPEPPSHVQDVELRGENREEKI